jgi:hypothetical protein
MASRRFAARCATSTPRRARSSSITIRYDPTARVDVSGQLYPLSNLERGDVIDVTLEPNGSSNYLAQRITLVRNVRH